MATSENSGRWSPNTESLFMSQYPLHYACKKGDLDLLSKLLTSKQHDVYEEDSFYGWTPIHLAAHLGRLRCLLKIVEHGAFFDVPTERLQQTPTHIAALKGQKQCLKWLLDSGGLINRQLSCVRRITTMCGSSDRSVANVGTTKHNQTPLHLCCLSGHPCCASWLIESGADIHAQDYLGETPLHKAARSGSLECTQLLLSKGCNTGIKNIRNQTPAQLAVECNFPQCAQYIATVNNGNVAVAFGQAPGLSPAEPLSGGHMTNAVSNQIISESNMECEDDNVSSRKRGPDNDLEEKTKRFRLTGLITPCQLDNSEEHLEVALWTERELDEARAERVLASYYSVLSVSTEPLRVARARGTGATSDTERQSQHSLFM